MKNIFKIKAKIKKLQWLAAIIIVSMFVTNSCNKSEYKYDIYEDRNIPACGVNDPLQNIKWLREYYESMKGSKDILYVSIKLFKLSDKDEFFFETSVESKSNKYRLFFEYRNCNGDIVHARQQTLRYSPSIPVPPAPDPWLADKVLVGTLYYFNDKYYTL